MLRTFVIGLLVASCHNQPPGESINPSTPPAAVANPASEAHDRVVVNDRARIEAQLQAHAAEIEAAFASGDCQTIALKRTAVEKRESYKSPFTPELMRDELTVQHSRLAEYDSRADTLGCELENCATFTDIYLKNSPAAQTIRDTTAKDTQAACYRVRNTLGEQLLSVKVSARATRGDIGVSIESGGSDTMRDGETVTFEASSVAAFAVRGLSMGNDGIAPEEGWQAVPFALTLTPVLRQPVAGQASAPTATQAK